MYPSGGGVPYSYHSSAAVALLATRSAFCRMLNCSAPTATLAWTWKEGAGPFFHLDANKHPLMSNINLDGGETSIIKALGFGGSPVSGDVLFERCSGLEEAEFIDTLKGLMMFGYVSCDDSSLQTMEQVGKAKFQVNSGYSRDLKEAVNPHPKKKSRRVRRE